MKIEKRVVVAGLVACALMLTIAGCGAQQSGSTATAGEEQGSSASQSASGAVDLSEYKGLESDSVVILFSDGSKEEYTRETAGSAHWHSGIKDSFFTIQEAYANNTAKANAKYEGATMIVKAPISIIDDSEYGVGWEGSWLGFGCSSSSDREGLEVLEPMIYLINCEKKILDMNLDKGDTILAAGPFTLMEQGRNRMPVMDGSSQIEKV